MPDLGSIVDDLKGVPDQALQSELVNPSGAVPPYLVLAEAQRRQTMRSAAQRSQQQSGTVYDDVIRDMTARQPPTGLPPAPVGMTPVASVLPSPAQPLPGAMPAANFQVPVRMQSGGLLRGSTARPQGSSYLDELQRRVFGRRYQEGGAVEDDNGDPFGFGPDYDVSDTDATRHANDYEEERRAAPGRLRQQAFELPPDVGTIYRPGTSRIDDLLNQLGPAVTPAPPADTSGFALPPEAGMAAPPETGLASFFSSLPANQPEAPEAGLPLGPEAGTQPPQTTDLDTFFGGMAPPVTPSGLGAAAPDWFGGQAPPETALPATPETTRLDDLLAQLGPAVEPEKPEEEAKVETTGEAGRQATQKINVADLREAMIDREGSRKPGTVGFRNNNPGNLRFTGQPEAIGKDAFGFAVFPNWAAGTRAMDAQIRNNLDRGLTLGEMIGGKPKVYAGWAPAKDRNDPKAYTEYVAGRTGYDPSLVMEEGAPAAKGQKPVLQAPNAQPSLPPLETGAPKQPAAAPVEPPAETPAETPEEQPPETAQPAETTEAPKAAGPPEMPAAPSVSPVTPTPLDSRLLAEIQPATPLLDPYTTTTRATGNTIAQDLTRRIFGPSPEASVRLYQAQLEQLKSQVAAGYRNPWAFLSDLAAGMANSKSPLLATAFASGAGYASDQQEKRQRQALGDYTDLTQAQERAEQGLINWQNRAAQTVYNVLNPPPAKPAAAGKPPSVPSQLMSTAVTTVGQRYNIPNGANLTTLQELPVSYVLPQDTTLQADVHNPDGSIVKAGTVLKAGTTVYPRAEASYEYNYPSVQKAGAQTIERLRDTQEGRRQIAQQMGWTGTDADQYALTGKPPVTATAIEPIAQQIANYQLDSHSPLLRGYDANARGALMARVNQLNPNWSDVNYANFKKNDQAYQGNGKQGLKLQSMRTAVNHLGFYNEVMNAMDQAQQTGNKQRLNALVQQWNQEMGPTLSATVNTIAGIIGKEVVNAYVQGGGVAEEREKLEGYLKASLSPGQRQNNLRAIGNLLGGAMNSMVDSYKLGDYGRGNLHAQFFPPETIKTLNTVAPGSIRTVTRYQIQKMADDHFHGNFEDAQRAFADRHYFLYP
jgi:hypothetical protein